MSRLDPKMSFELAKPSILVRGVFVLGQEPKAGHKGKYSAEEYIERTLAPINGRVVLYNALIANAESQYQEYLDASDKSKDLDKLLDSLNPDS